jgi:predicted nucleic acid-binding protein
MRLLDTGVLLELLREKRYEAGAISVLTLLEILRGLRREKREQVKRAIEESFTVCNLENRVILTYCELYRRLREEGVSLPDADLLIAATAIVNKMPLKTKDEHFKYLEKFGLVLEG